MLITNTTISFSSICILTCLAACFSIVAWPQEARPVPIDAVVGVDHLDPYYSPQFSPDATSLAYVVKGKQERQSQAQETVARTGVYASRQDIWIWNAGTRDERNLTAEKGANWLPTWSPDGNMLAFVSDRDGSGQARLWIWDKTKNDLKKLSDITLRTPGASQLVWTRDGRGIFVPVLPQDLSVGEYAAKMPFPNQEASKSKEQSSTVHLYHSSSVSAEEAETPKSDPWNLNVYLRDLVKIDVETGQITVLIHGKRVGAYKLSPDGSQLAYTIPTQFERPGSQQVLFDLATVMVATKQERIVASNIRLNFDGTEFSWSPDGKLLTYHMGGIEEMTNDCFVVDSMGGKSRNVTNLTPLLHVSDIKSSIPLWDRSAENIYFVREGALWRASLNKGEATELARISNHELRRGLVSLSENLIWTTEDGRSTIVVAHDDLAYQDGFYEISLASGQSTRLLERGQCYGCGMSADPYALTNDGQQIAYVAEDAQHVSDLWLTDRTFGSLRRITSLNAQLDRYQMGSVRVIDWLSDDGERLHGALLLPSDYQEGRRYPLVVWVYGGEMLSRNLVHFGLSYGLNMQLLATRGYAVLLPDSPQHEGTPMIDLAKTVLPGVNKVIEMGIADSERLGVMGHSNGGYSTLALIVQTKRFKAAIDVDGMGDLVGMYGEMNSDGTAYGIGVLEHAQDKLGGTPWQDREKYIENSPFFYLDRVETPLLIVHGAEDRAVAPFLADQIFVALRRLGKEVEYAKYDGEGHAPAGYANEFDYCNRAVAWFEKYLKKGSK